QPTTSSRLTLSLHDALPIYVFEETHAQHLVGLVEHDGREGVEAEGAAAQVVHHAPRRPDDHVQTAAQPADLLADGLAAVDGHHRSEEHTSELQSRENLVCRL